MTLRNKEENSTVPEPTTARLELPSIEAVRALGLELDLEEARLVLVALSGVIGSGRSKSREKVAQMNRAVTACCGVEGVRDGELVAAAHPELGEFGWPSGQRALRELGIDHRRLERYWQMARRRATDACLPLAWVLAFVPARLWPAVLSVIAWGPAEAAWRLEETVVAWAQRPLAVTTRRRGPGATLSAGTINTRISGIHNLYAVLVGLRERALASRDPGLPLALLEPWLAKPARPDVEECGAVWANVDTAGPSLEQAQTLLRRVEAEAAKAPRQSRYLRHRRRLLAGLLLAHGQRIETIHALDVSDYRPAHNFGDGVIGPALIYHPGKTRLVEEEHILALPAELAGWLEEWIRASGREPGDSGSLWPHRKPKPGKLIKRINASAFSRIASGHAAKDGTGSLALLPRNGDPYEGYNPHAFRHTCFQTMRRAGAQALLEQSQLYLGHSPDDFARAVVGHDLVRSVGDLYRDLDQQHLARIAIDYGWTELRRTPTRLGLDPAAIEEACEPLELLNDALRQLATDLAAIEQRQATILSRLNVVKGDELEAARIASNTLVFELARLQIEIATTRSRQQQARCQLEHALQHEAELEITPSDAYQQQLADASARAGRVLNTDPLAWDQQFSIKEIATIVGDCHRKTINSWIRDGIPSHRPQLWSHGAWTQTAAGMWLLPIDALDQTALTPIQQERLLLTRLRSPRDNRAAA
jgi:integrase